MSVVVLGLSHRSAPMSVLERVALDDRGVRRLASVLLGGNHVDEVLVLATCNRLEVYASARTFHGAVADIGEGLSATTGVPRSDLNDHFYVHYEDRAVAHLFSVACGLDAMAVGEAQVLGQLRDALARAQASGEIGPVLNVLVQHALHVGKRAHTETELDRYGSSLVEEGLNSATAHVGPLADARVLVVGAGAMSSLVAATAARCGVAALHVVNRTAEKGQRLAAATGATALSWAQLPAALVDSDVILSCTGALEYVVEPGDAAAAAAAREGRPQAFVDLALPRDVHPDVALVPGAAVVGLAELGDRLAGQPRGSAALKQVQELVVGEVGAYLTNRRQNSVGPTVAALRARAADLVAAELDRLETRLPSLTDADRAEVRRTVHRVVEKLLHTPTVRVKELAASEPGGDYAAALRELFDLGARDVAVVSRPPAHGGAGYPPTPGEGR